MKPESTEDKRIRDPIVRPSFISLKEASARTGLSVGVLREAIWRGELPYIQFRDKGKMWIEAGDIDEFCERIRKKYKRMIK